MSEYNEQAEGFLRRFGLHLTIQFTGSKCPAWRDPKLPKCEQVAGGTHYGHGKHYVITISRKRNLSKVVSTSTILNELCPNGHAVCLSPACWIGGETAETRAREAARAKGERYPFTLTRTETPDALSFDFWGSIHDAENGREPSAYDVLACISSDCFMPDDPDEVAEECGPMKPSQAIAVVEFGRKLRAFFTEAEQAAVAEIL